MSGTLPSDTFQNPTKVVSCKAFTTRSGKVLTSPPVGKPMVDVMEDDVEEAESDHPVESKKLDEVIYITPSNH